MHVPITITAIAAMAAVVTTAPAQETCGPEVVDADGVTTQACSTPLDPTDIHCDQTPDVARNPATGDRHITLTICPDPLVDQLRHQLRRERARHATVVRRLKATNRRLRAHARVKWQPNVTEAITIASLVSGVPEPHLRRVIHCESGGRHWAINTSSGASGLVQYLPSTWQATTFGRAGLDRFSPYANAIQGALAMRHSMRPWDASRHCWGDR